MKAVILAGGYGTRISEESATRPKPMVEIGGKPILWHIMKHFSHYGIHDFIICLGYKGYVIKEYFADYALHGADVRFDMRNGKMELLADRSEPWSVTLVETGLNSMTGGRLKGVEKYLDGESFMMTYGDGVADIDLNVLMDFHKNHGAMATVTAVQPPGRFGAFTMSEDQTRVEGFREKPKGDGAWINGGFFVLEPKVIGLIDGMDTVWEQKPMQKLSGMGELYAYKHSGFWQPMDTLRDRNLLEDLWASGQAPWKLWKDKPVCGQ